MLQKAEINVNANLSYTNWAYLIIFNKNTVPECTK